MLLRRISKTFFNKNKLKLLSKFNSKENFSKKVFFSSSLVFLLVYKLNDLRQKKEIISNATNEIDIQNQKGIERIRIDLQDKENMPEQFDRDIQEALKNKQNLMTKLADESQIVVMAGNSHRELAKEIATHLDVQLGRINISKDEHTSDSKIQILDNVEGKHVYIVQSLCPPINDNVLEFLLIVSALKRANAEKVTAVVPYFGYSRHVGNSHMSILKKHNYNYLACADVVKMLTKMGVDQFITVNFHNHQVKGFFSKPLINIDASKLVADYFKTQLPHINQITLISPAVKRNYVWRVLQVQSHLLKNNIEINGIGSLLRQTTKYQPSLDETRFLPNYKYQYIGPSIKDKDCLLIDSIVCSAKTLDSSVKWLRQQGARKVYVYVSHGIFSGDATKIIQNTPLEELIVTNTIPEKMSMKKIRYLSIGKILADVIANVHAKISLEEMRQLKQQNYYDQNDGM